MATPKMHEILMVHIIHYYSSIYKQLFFLLDYADSRLLVTYDIKLDIIQTFCLQEISGQSTLEMKKSPVLYGILCRKHTNSLF
jgi:hypothetical protein